jgi:hypothetical protein
VRVAVVFAPLEVSRDFIDYPYFADLGAVQIAAVLRQAGHEVVLADALALPGSTLEPTSADRIRLGASPRELMSSLTTDVDAFVVALSPFAVPPRRDKLLAEVLEHLTLSSSAPIVLADLHQGGQHVVDAPPDAVLAAYPEASIYLRHEAEASILALLADLEPRATRRAASGVDPSPLDDVVTAPRTRARANEASSCARRSRGVTAERGSTRSSRCSRPAAHAGFTCSTSWPTSARATSTPCSTSPRRTS